MNMKYYQCPEIMILSSAAEDVLTLSGPHDLGELPEIGFDLFV